MANTMKLGINGSAVRYWTNQSAFKDLRKNGGFYWTATSGDYDTDGDFIPHDGKTDASGNPSSYTASAGGSMPTGTFARALLANSLTNLPTPYPSGIYHILWDGSGTIDLGSDPDWPSSSGLVAPGDVSFTINTPTAAGILLDISSAPGGDYLRNIRVVHDDDLSTYENQPFNQRMLDSLKELSDSDGGYFRAMNWNYINGDGGNPRWTSGPDEFHLAWRVSTSSWDTRVIPAMPQGKIGCSLEYAVSICNSIDRNLWYCVPHRATSDFITSAATYIKDNLNSSLSTVVEWSNEFWNGGFYQQYYCYSGAADPTVSAQYYGGLSTGPGNGGTGNDTRAANRYGADRTKEAWDIFYSVFGEAASTRVIRTIGTQSGNSWQGERMLEWSGVNSEGAPVSSCDSISIAPYFGGSFGRDPIASQILNDSSSVAQVIASATYDVSAPLGGIRTDVQEHKTLADSYGIDLYLYEGGQHLVGVGAALENSMYAIFSACNDDPGMGTLYGVYLDMLQEEGVKVSCMYRSMGKNSKQTMFGLQQFYGQSIRPKYDAVLAWLGVQPELFVIINNVGYRININS